MKTFTDKLYYFDTYNHVASVSYIKRIDTPIEKDSAEGTILTHEEAQWFLRRHITPEKVLIFTIKVVKNPDGEYTIYNRITRSDAVTGETSQIHIDNMFIGRPHIKSHMACGTLRKAIKMLGDDTEINVDVYITAGGDTIKL